VFADFFIRRPIFASVCSMIILLVGAVSIPGLPIEQYPAIAFPQVTVTSFYTGASAQVVESAVTIPLEQQINGVEGMKYISSLSGNDGSSVISVTFDVTRNIDLAAVDIQNRVQTALPSLPNEVKQTGVVIAKTSTSIVLALGLYSDGDQYSTLFLSNYADVYMRDALKRVPGVGDVRIFGERRFAMRLWLDPVQLAARQLTASDVVRALSEQNIQVAAGQVGQAPAPPNQTYQISLRALSRLAEPKEFDDIILKTGPEGTLVRLRDVGRAELGAQDYNSLLRFDGREAVGLGIFQLPNSNALEVAKQVKAELARLSQTFPRGMHYRIAFDTTRAVSESVNEVLKTLGEAILLVILVIFLFLQTLRSTLIPAITIPVSLIGTFFFVKAFGFSINTLTLFGITLATGLVVDDAIVVIENIERFVEQRGMSARQAAAPAMREVFGAVIATSLVLIAVFVPVSFFPGVTGRIYQQFSLTLAFSVAISAFISVTLTPSLSALLLGQHRKQGAFFRFFNRLMARTTERYRAALRRLLGHQLAVLGASAVALVATYLLFVKVPTGFIPDEDQGYLIISVQAPEGSSLAYLEGIMKQSEAELQKIPEISDMFSVGGFSFTGTAPNKGIIFVNLKPWDERTRPEQTLGAIIGRLRGPLLSIPGAVVLPFNPPAIRGVGSLGGFQFEIEDRGNAGTDILAQATQATVGAGNRQPGLQALFSSFTVNDPQIVLDIDRERAKALGVSLNEIFSTLQTLIGSQYVNDFDFGNRVYRVYVQAEADARSNPRDLERLYVRSSSGRMVSLSSLMSRKETVSPQVISHYNLFRSAEVNGAAAPGTGSGDALRAMESVAQRTLPPGMGYEWSGIALEQLQSASQSLVIFVLGLVFVFLVLAAQYESLVLPLIVMMAVPLAIFGALLALMLRGLSNDIFFQVGLVMLIGLSSKNAILIVEFAHQLRDRGESIVGAAINAAGIRLRPILMTSLAFILGVLPLVTAKGAGSASRHSLGTAVFGGMIVSTILNLFLIPVLYVAVETARERLRGKAGEHVAPAHQQEIPAK
jgi:HAE1 family hydrophobic/amphiphilic exporter-1